MSILETREIHRILAKQSRAPSGVLVSYTPLRDSGGMATSEAQFGDFWPSACAAENSSHGPLELTGAHTLDAITSVWAVPSGAHIPMALIQEPEAYGDFAGRTCVHWNPGGSRVLDGITGADPQSSSGTALLAPRATTGGVGDTTEMFRIWAITADDPLWFIATIYLGFLCARILAWPRAIPTSYTGTGTSKLSTGSGSMALHCSQNSGARPTGGSPLHDRGRERTGTATGLTTGVATDGATNARGEVKIMYWNIFHDFTLKLTSKEFHSLLQPYDIMFFAEADMLPGEEDPADVPRGYSLVSLPRKPRFMTNRRGGENARGLEILEECDKYGLCILNGTFLETASPGRYTSHQPRATDLRCTATGAMEGY
ncbi:hypothetical protein B0H14DRAFT_2638211 [Mycena olivaceomarginata]|nr:hypothetical protein B0H14DRAFT_2638211 [Mycena olivaceomarginata]